MSEHPLPAHAVGEVVGEVLERLSGPIDLLCVFVGAGLTGAIEDIHASLRSLLQPGALIGSTACGVLSQTSEAEDRPALSIWAATGITARTFRIPPAELEPVNGWQGLDADHALLLSDPFSVPQVELLDRVAEAAPALTLHGGLSSAANGPGGNRLLLDGAIHHSGAVGVALSDVSMTSVVSQGCRPVGDAFTVTGVEGNVITSLGSQAPLERLQAIADAADDDERSLLASGVHIGIVMDEQQDSFVRGDFLIRAVLGADRDSGALAIGAEVPVGTTVQFQVRDAATASEDLAVMLTEHDAVAALTFTCNGRGKHLFGESGHDAEMVHLSTGSGATAGMFCAGELGPIGGTNQLHGFTASSLLFHR